MNTKIFLFYILTTLTALTALTTLSIATGLDTDYADSADSVDSVNKYNDVVKEYEYEHQAYNQPFTDQNLTDLNNKQTVASFPIIIQPVSFVVLYMGDKTGRVTYEQLQRQIDVLNYAFSGSEAIKVNYQFPKDTGIRFKLAGVRYVKNDDLFNLCTLPSMISKYKPKFMMDGSKHLNIYVCWCKNMLGISWLPYVTWYRDKLSEGHFSLGPIIHHELLPGNNFNGGLWSKGNILTHECGHSYGLKHIYEGDCFGTEKDSDGIFDTPRQTGNPLKPCSVLRGLDSCKNNMRSGQNNQNNQNSQNRKSVDDISNYMSATGCQSHFTPGQVIFMQNVILRFKPTLIKQLLPDPIASITDNDNSPDLQPCLKGTLKKKTMYINIGSGKGGKKVRRVVSVCNTDPDNNKIWAIACVPSGPNWYEDECRLGIPDFNFRIKIKIIK